MKPGDMLGPYRILDKLGEGGMGEVYKANDTRLDRTVAIKILPAALAADPGFKARFEREARSISALNHPNICTLFDVGEGAPANPESRIPHPVVNYLVMEYLEGETLAARLDRGALPLADALKIATEIASALDKAHRVGIVHRDLKPGNIMLVKSGGARSDATQAKLLDFGLAKIGPADTVSAAAPTALATSPRPTAQALTAQGTILGTFQYMAPEQIDGEEADARTDIFAFGAVLFETLTGRKAFAGKSQASLLGAILKDEPPAVSQAQALAPPALDHLVRTCLAKDPDARFQTAHDLLLQLKWIAEGGSAAGVAAPVVAHRRNPERLAWITAAALGVALLVTATMTVRHLREAAPVVDPREFTIGAPENSTFSGTVPQFAISPDGRQVVFVASREGAPVLWVRRLSTLVAKHLKGTDLAMHPFWSADSRSIGFFAGGKLKTVLADGGTPVEICDASSDRGGAWNPDNVILFSPLGTGPLHRVTLPGRTTAPATVLAKGEISHRWPTFLPDGKHYLFFAGTGDGLVGEIRAGSLDSQETVPVAAAYSNGSYSEGYLVFGSGEGLMAQPFHLGTRKTTADAFQVAGQLAIDDMAYGAFSVTATNMLMYAPGSARSTARLTRFDLVGHELGTVGNPGEYFNMSLSPDDRQVAVSRITPPGNRDIWVIDRDHPGDGERLTTDVSADFLPVWSPKTVKPAQIAFTSSRAGAPWNIYVRPASGSGQEELKLKSALNKLLSDWSRDGRYLAYVTQASETNLDIWVQPLSGDKTPVKFLATTANEESPVFSPDGRWIAYDSDESGKPQIYVKPFPATDERHRISYDGGSRPVWQGDEVFFLALDNTVMSATVSTAKGLVNGTPKKRFPMSVSSRGSANSYRHQYAVTSDGKEIVAIVRPPAIPSPITVVVNWLATRQR